MESIAEVVKSLEKILNSSMREYIGVQDRAQYQGITYLAF